MPPGTGLTWSWWITRRSFRWPTRFRLLLTATVRSVFMRSGQTQEKRFDASSDTGSEPYSSSRNGDRSCGHVCQRISECLWVQRGRNTTVKSRLTVRRGTSLLLGIALFPSTVAVHGSLRARRLQFPDLAARRLSSSGAASSAGKSAGGQGSPRSSFPGISPS